MSAPILSRADIEQIAERIVAIYTEAYVPEKHLFYRVIPEELAEVLGLEVDYQILSLDGTILGVTAPDEQYVSVYDNKQECCYYLDGNTILIDTRLCASSKTIGRKNYTLAHEIAHQVLYKAFPDAYASATRIMCDYRRTPNTRKKVTNWTEWQADALAAALLLPKDAILDGMFLFSLGEHINTLSRKYTPNKYDNFCYLATALGVSQSALAYRMEQLGLLDRCFLYKK